MCLLAFEIYIGSFLASNTAGLVEDFIYISILVWAELPGFTNNLSFQASAGSECLSSECKSILQSTQAFIGKRNPVPGYV